MGGGIISFLDSISGAQVREGAQVSILYSRRPDTPDRRAIEDRFGPHVRLLPEVDAGSTMKNVLAIGRSIRSAVASGEYDVVHLHSSYAGAVGRIMLIQSGVPVVYSPHGFAFLRLDQSKLLRWATRMIERILARRGSLLVTSQSELDIAAEELRTVAPALLMSGVPSATIRHTSSAREVGRPRVVMLGRLVYQKAPWRFAHVARQIGAAAEFIWVGGDASQDEHGWMTDSPVRMLAWVEPDELERLLQETDILLFPTLWEGMSLSLAQAQARGIPVVTTDVVGNRDAVINGVTGFVCNTDEELLERTRQLVDDTHLRMTMGAAAVEWARQGLIDDNIGTDSLAYYGTRVSGAPHA